MSNQTITRTVNEIQIMELHGRFDAHVVPNVQKWLEEQQQQGMNRILVNMKGVTFIDTRALSLLVTGLKRSRQADGDLCLCSLQQPVQIIFELMHLDKAFEIFKDEAEALSSFQKSVA
jgi:anti-anti-sigma factor